MALRGNGQLLVKVSGQPFTALMGAAATFALEGYDHQPLLPHPQLMRGFAAGAPADHWLLAKPTRPTPSATALAAALAAPATPVPGATPWDDAHAAAGSQGYAHYIEPDILHEKTAPEPRNADRGLNNDWPPYVEVSPGWHLQAGFTGFAAVRGTATGHGARIAHLDTGYTPSHASTPRNIRPALGYNFWNDNADTVDPGTSVPGCMPGHGTATLALLAGNTLDLTFGGQVFQGDFGGAPDAEVIPVRICPSVIHLYTSTMAKGLNYALAPGGDPANRCHVISLSHGGLPSESWADAVNALYDAGVTVVAASGDSFYWGIVDLATRYTVYPSAFNRVVTAVGATYTKQPYIATKLGDMQGCWGPDPVMGKAVAAYTPNVAWMRYNDAPDGFDMDGAGTSASTPQIAAACALWLGLNGARLPDDWRKVEACRLALFKSAVTTRPDKSELGWGIIDVPGMLAPALATQVVDDANQGRLSPSAADTVSFPFWRVLTGTAPPGSDAEEKMYETEVAQVVLESGHADLLQAAGAAAGGAALSTPERVGYLRMLSGEAISQALGQRIAKVLR